MKVGLYFGTFNPIHVGHLIIGEAALNFTDIQQLWFVVSPGSPDKNHQKLLHEFDRFDLVKEAISGQAKMRVTDIEFSLPKPSYTYLTLRKLKEKHPEHEFFIVMGSDNYANLHKWKNIEEIRQQVRFIVYPRSMEEKWMQEDDLAIKIEAPLLQISGTYIRNLIKSEKSIDFLVPEGCSKLIREKRYYQ